MSLEFRSHSARDDARAAERRSAACQDAVVIIWLNGTFGAGKTTTARLLAQRDQRFRVFDPESVGYLLRENLGDFPVGDFRDWESWRVLTPIVADELIRFTGQHLVAPQTVFEESYWDELIAGLAQRGHQVQHVLLEADDDVLRARIEANLIDADAGPWRLGHVSTYALARGWLSRRADAIVDTTDSTPAQVADRVWKIAQGHIE